MAWRSDEYLIHGEIDNRTPGRAMVAFVERHGGAMSVAEESADDDEPDDDEPTSAAEAAADAEQARMDLLLDRVQGRIERAVEAGEAPDHEVIFEQERERLRIERGEPEPEPLTPAQEADRAGWIDAMNTAAEEAVAQSAAEDWRDEEDGDHALVVGCAALHRRVHAYCATRGWLTDADTEQHPLREIGRGVMIAGAKLAGALNSLATEDDWPPEPLFAGGTLVRLKKARRYLRDALAGADAAVELGLTEPAWLAQISAELLKLINEVETLIAEVRAVLENDAD